MRKLLTQQLTGPSTYSYMQDINYALAYAAVRTNGYYPKIQNTLGNNNPFVLRTIATAHQRPYANMKISINSSCGNNPILCG